MYWLLKTASHLRTFKEMDSFYIGDNVNKDKYEGFYLLRRYKPSVFLFYSPNQHFPFHF